MEIDRFYVYFSLRHTAKTDWDCLPPRLKRCGCFNLARYQSPSSRTNPQSSSGGWCRNHDDFPWSHVNRRLALFRLMEHVGSAMNRTPRITLNFLILNGDGCLAAVSGNGQPARHHHQQSDDDQNQYRSHLKSFQFSSATCRRFPGTRTKPNLSATDNARTAESNSKIALPPSGSVFSEWHFSWCR